MKKVFVGLLIVLGVVVLIFVDDISRLISDYKRVNDFLEQNQNPQHKTWHTGGGSHYTGVGGSDNRIGKIWYTTKNIMFLVFFLIFGWAVILLIPGFAFGKLERLAEGVLISLVPGAALVLQSHHGWSHMSPNLGLWILLLYSTTLVVVLYFSQKKAWMALIWLAATVGGLVWKLW